VRGKPCLGRGKTIPTGGFRLPPQCLYDACVLTQKDTDREIRDGDIVRLRLDGLTYREIAEQFDLSTEQFDLSISQCQRMGLAGMAVV
jgi:hypothetical protein